MVVMIDNTIAGVAGTAAFSPVLVGSRRFGKFVIRTHEETEQRYCHPSRQIASSRRWASPEIEAETVDENADSNVSDRMLSMDDLLLPTPDCDVNQIGPTAMAYIGDVVFELFVRSKMIWPARKTSDLQNKVVSLVRGECRTERKNHPTTTTDPTLQDKSISAAVLADRLPFKLYALCLTVSKNQGLISLLSYRMPSQTFVLLPFPVRSPAEHQAKLLLLIQDRFALTQKEESIVTRGRNSGSVKGNKRKPVDYAHATAFEALLGYLYLTDRTRCEELLNFVYTNLELDDTTGPINPTL